MGYSNGYSNYAEFKEDRGWVDSLTGEPDPNMNQADKGRDLMEEFNARSQTFRFLQTMVAGEGNALPFAPPCVRIVTAKEGWKEDYALVYGFPERGESGPLTSGSVATRFPAEATSFRIYYGANYGPGGYKKIETSHPLDDEITRLLETGEFTDEEGEKLVIRMMELEDIYWELNLAARNPAFNPDFAEQAEATFYRNANQVGL